MNSCSASRRRRHHRRRPGVAEVAFDADVLAERRPAAEPHREVEHVERGLAGDRLGLQHPQRRVRRGRRPARRSRRRRASLAASALVLHRARRAGGRRAGRPAIWSRCSKRARRHVPDRLARCAASIRPEAARRVEDLEHRQHDAERDVEPGAVVAERERDAGTATLDARPPGSTRCRAARARRTARPTFSPAASPGTSHSVAPAAAVDRPARPHVGVGLAGRGHPALAGVEHDLVAVGRRRAERRPEVAARPGLGERQRRQVLAGGDRPTDVVGAVLPRSPRSRE